MRAMNAIVIACSSTRLIGSNIAHVEVRVNKKFYAKNIFIFTFSVTII